MVQAMHGNGEAVDVFEYYLAERLGRTLTELGDMPNPEYLGWAAYFKAKAMPGTER